jgi:sulfotransferase family protein
MSSRGARAVWRKLSALLAWQRRAGEQTIAGPAGILGPYVIGATGGSGTRVVARLVRHGGLFIGTRLNISEDALDFGDYSDRWVNVFLAGRAAGLPPATRAAMLDDLTATLAKHLASLDPTAPAWGWKEPRSIFLLPFFHSQLPALKFLHVIRDGRDMAYSANQNQLRKHGDLLLDGNLAGASEPVRSIALWSRLNLLTAEYGETVLRTRYLRIRFEDLCREPGPTIARIFAFFGLRGDVEDLARLEVSPPESLGRWRSEAPDTLEEVLRAGRLALERFGYDARA